MVPYEILIRGNDAADAIKGIHVIAKPGDDPRVLAASDLPEIFGEKSQLLSQISCLNDELTRLRTEMLQTVPVDEVTGITDAGN